MIWMFGERERRLERQQEARRLRQSGESLVVREGRLERRLANESADDREQQLVHVSNVSVVGA